MAEELDNYAALVKQIKQEIQSARIKVSRQGKAVTNFEMTLPAAQSDLSSSN